MKTMFQKLNQKMVSVAQEQNRTTSNKYEKKSNKTDDKTKK